MAQSNQLAEDLLRDLYDLEDEEEVKDQNEAPQDLEMEEEEEDENEEKETAPVDTELTEKDKLQQAKGVSNLIDDPKFNKTLEKIDKFSQAANAGANGMNANQRPGLAKEGLDDEEYLLITSCTEYVSVVDREIANIHKFIRDIYIVKFPELENLILNPMEYVKCVLLIRNETDMNRVDLTEVLSQHTIMAVNLAGSSTTGKRLPEKELQKAIDACHLVLRLDELKRKVIGLYSHPQVLKILSYVESRMRFLAPNLCEVIGSTGASQLIAVAGGIEALAAMPACNIQVIGAQRKNLLGFSKAIQQTHLGLFGTMDIVKNAPKEFRTKLVRLLSTNCAKAVRVDVQRTDPTGSIGRDINTKMLQRFDKIQEPSAPKMRKPLAAPDDKPKKRRGGKKYRNMKEKLALTDIRKEANRLKFGTEGEDEYRESGKGFGMLGSSGMGRIKVTAKDNKLNLTKKQKKDLAGNMNSANISGLTSSIVMTQTRGIELVNPDYASKFGQKSGPANFFNEESGFRTVIQQKQGNSVFGNVFNPK